MRIFRLVVELLAVAGIAIVGLHYVDRAYAMPLWVVIVALAAGGAAAFAADWSARREFRVVAVLSALIATIVVGVASILSIGSVLLVLAVIFGVVVIRRMAPIPVGAWIGAAVVGVALSGLAFLAIQKPIVSCTDDAISGSTNLWMQPEGGAGNPYTIEFRDPSGGTFSIGDKRFVYGCRGGELEYLDRRS